MHFGIGIGGIGMSGIAEVMHNLGYSVQGSDIRQTKVENGGGVFIGAISIAVGEYRVKRGAPDWVMTLAGVASAGVIWIAAHAVWAVTR